MPGLLGLLGAIVVGLTAMTDVALQDLGLTFVVRLTLMLSSLIVWGLVFYGVYLLGELVWASINSA